MDNLIKNKPIRIRIDGVIRRTKNILPLLSNSLFWRRIETVFLLKEKEEKLFFIDLRKTIFYNSISDLHSKVFMHL
jgi:hypothetical protein